MSVSGVTFIIVGKQTGRADWSDELYLSKDAAIESLCSPWQDYGNDKHDPRRNWRKDFEIRRVMPATATRAKL